MTVLSKINLKNLTVYSISKFTSGSGSALEPVWINITGVYVCLPPPLLRAHLRG